MVRRTGKTDSMPGAIGVRQRNQSDVSQLGRMGCRSKASLSRSLSRSRDCDARFCAPLMNTCCTRSQPARCLLQAGHPSLAGSHRGGRRQSSGDLAIGGPKEGRGWTFGARLRCLYPAAQGFVKVKMNFLPSLLCRIGTCHNWERITTNDMTFNR